MRLLPMLTVLAAVAATAEGPKPILVPLVFVHGEDEATIRKVVREVAEAGNTGFVWESRPHPDYLGPRWWRDLGAAIDEAKKRGLEVWLFDEWMYPSGVAGGKVVAENPDFTVHTIVDRSVEVEGPLPEQAFTMPGGEARILSVAAVPVPWTSGSRATELSGKGRSVTWTVPKGRYRIVWAVEERIDPRPGWLMDNMIDVMNPRATEAFLRITHEATYRHFGADFGKTIKGFFSDESGFRNVTSYASLPGTAGMPLPWSPTFADYFRQKKGYDAVPRLAALWYDLGPEGRKFRFDFTDACAKAFAEHFFQPQQEWCRKHNVRLIGHLVEDNHADHQLGYGPGHWFRAMRQFDMPGIDVVGYQVTPGLDAGPYRWTLPGGVEWDQEHFSFGLPAMARGSALEKHTNEIFAESFGAYGWSEGLRMLKWIGDWLIVNGINVISPHAVSMKFHDEDCPPHYNRTAGNPQWRYYPVWAERFKRLQKLTLESTPLYDAAVLYTAESAWMGAAQNVAPVVRALETAQVSTFVLPYDTFVASGTLGQQTAVVLPYVERAPAELLERLGRFAAEGGRVFVLERWPGDAPAELKQHARLLALPELAGQVRHAVQLDPPSASVVVSRRKGEGGEWVLLQNRSLDSTWRGRLNVRGARFDAGSNRWFQAEEIEIPPYELCTLWTGKAPVAAESAPHYRTVEEITGPWQAGRATDDTGTSFEPLGDVTKLIDWRGRAGLEQYSGTIRYHRVVTIRDPRGVALDAGEVGEIAELRVNGRPAGVRIAPPYRWEIGTLARAGENEIELDVTNTAQARWRDEFSHGDATSGLLGPVRLMRVVSK